MLGDASTQSEPLLSLTHIEVLFLACDCVVSNVASEGLFCCRRNEFWEKHLLSAAKHCVLRDIDGRGVIPDNGTRPHGETKRANISIKFGVKLEM